MEKALEVKGRERVLERLTTLVYIILSQSCKLDGVGSGSLCAGPGSSSGRLWRGKKAQSSRLHGGAC